jgi:hypothetical protein
MPTTLKNLRVREISLVDAGANPHARVMLLKRDETDAEAEEYLKREFSADQRKEMASKGTALPDGSFPIANEADLKNAIRAIGRASDPAKAKAHIRARAKALGKTDLLPADWVSKRGLAATVLAKLGLAKAADFEQAQAVIESGEYANELMEELGEAVCALRSSVCSIMDDEAVADKQAAIGESFDQFKEHVAGLVPGEVEKAMRGAALVASNTAPSTAEGEPPVTDTTDVAKQLAERDTELAKLREELAIAKMSDPHKAYMAKMDGDKGKFAAMSADERDAHMAKNPVKKSADAEAEIAKRLDLEKRLEAAEAEIAKAKAAEQRAEFVKMATEAGLTAAAGETIQKAAGGDRDALGKLMQIIKAQHAQIGEGKLYGEFGTARGGDTTSAEAQVMAKAEELRKADPKLSKQQAIAKVQADPANRDIWTAYKNGNQRAA